MPLEPGKSRAAFSHNVSTEMREGHKPQKQAVAIAYSEQRRTDSQEKLDEMVAMCDAYDCRADDFDGLVHKLEGKGYSHEYATKIAGKVAAEKGKTGHH
jgi:hypothetical protein